MLRKLAAEALGRLSRSDPPWRADSDVIARLVAAAGRLEAGELEAARRICIGLLGEHPDLADAANLLGEIAFRRREFALAAEHFSEAIAIDAGCADYHDNHGNALAELGRVDEAAAAFRCACHLDPRHPRARQNLLWLMNARPEFDAAARFEEHCRWAEACAEPLCPEQPSWPNERDPNRRLRIGYVSPDFRTHAVGHFIEPILAQHDSRKVEVVLYSCVGRPDEATARMRDHAAGWRDIAALSDEAAAAQVRADAIDILVDLAGHTRGNRLLVFARRPAPVQVTFLGYPATTGMRAMDFRLTDALADPPGAERWYREQLVRLPHGLWCYAPAGEMPPAGDLPALAGGRVTFGSMNSAAKLNPALLDLWGRILARVPDSRLVLATVPRGEREQDIREQLARHRIDASRLVFFDRVEPAAYLALFREIDVALDPFPCNGGTTTCESLWMGVPVVSLAGDEFRSRAGLSLLTRVGLQSLVAPDPFRYVEKAVALASDLDALAKQRAKLRERVRHSALGDVAGYVASLEQAYRSMWMSWCHA